MMNEDVKLLIWFAQNNGTIHYDKVRNVNRLILKVGNHYCTYATDDLYVRVDIFNEILGPMIDTLKKQVESHSNS